MQVIVNKTSESSSVSQVINIENQIGVIDAPSVLAFMYKDITKEMEEVKKEEQISHLESAQLENNIDTNKIKNDIYNLHDKRLELKNLPERKSDLFMITEKIIQLVSQTTRIDLNGYKVSIDKDEIIHTLKKHGDPIVEAKRDQIAVEREDFIRFFYILLDPDKVTKSASNTLHTNKPCLQFEKTTDYKTIVILEIREVSNPKKKKTSTLAFKTMYKKKLLL